MAESSSDERRDYYRINDRVGFNFTICVDEDEVPSEANFALEIPDEFQLINHLIHIDMENSSLLHSIQDASPDVSRYLKVINSKIDALARHMVVTGLTDEIKTREVTLSAGGISFESSDPISLDRILRTQMILYPSCSGILTYGKVVRCEPIKKGKDALYDIAMEYIRIHETDRDALVRHVLQLQSTYLRQKK
ncbi:MAG: hypothetical protein DRQ47_10795 [Gammaproteobacteria bacterium]|nr:MAG: hypothetical protein DRQ47_10795 [Gammaproteobacteria bacterium]